MDSIMTNTKMKILSACCLEVTWYLLAKARKQVNGKLKVCRMVHFTKGNMENGFVEEFVENYQIKDVYGA